MKRRKSDGRKTVQWRHYDEVAQVESISVGEGIALLVEHWPEDGQVDRTAVKKRIRTRVEDAISLGQLVVWGSGAKARVSPVEYFVWAVGGRLFEEKKQTQFAIGRQEIN